MPITLENFEIFCRCAWLWIRVMHEKGRSKALVIEELADVSPPGSHVDLLAESDTLVVLSACPQMLNPCNGYDPTPVRLIVTAPA